MGDIIDKKELCAICKTKEAVTTCDGCGIALCRDCRKIELWSTGCGHAYNKVFCQKCHDDVDINPFGANET